MKTIRFLCLLMAMLFVSTTYSQGSTAFEKVSSDAFLEKLTDAHHIYQESASSTAKEVRRKYGKYSPQFKEIVRADSIFRAARGNINSLVYNIEQLDSTNQQLAVADIDRYIREAEVLDSERSLTLKKMSVASRKIEKSNDNISKEYQLELDGSTWSVAPNNSYEVRIKFDFEHPPGHPEKYFVYLFPKNWLYLEDRLYGADAESWKNIASYYEVLDKYAHKWVYGARKTIENIYTGKFMLILVDKNKHVISYFQDVRIPANKFFEYTITN